MNQFKKKVWAVTHDGTHEVTHLISFPKPVTAKEAMSYYYEQFKMPVEQGEE